MQMPSPSTPIQKSKALVKRYTPEDAKALLLQNSKVKGDLGDALERCSEIFSRPKSKGRRDKDEEQRELQEPALSAMFALEVETHVALMDSFNEKYRGMAKELCAQIIRENNCSTHMEKMLAETIAGSFVRYIDSSKRYNSYVPGDSTSSEQNHLLAVMSKQIDRAHRQFLSSFAMLRQIKQPQLEVNIRAKNAFVAGNQQINATPAKP